MKTYIQISILIGFLLGCSTIETKKPGWCMQPLRSQFADLDETDVESTWFKVYLVGEGVYAIAEPYNFQEVISYLILGKEKALLFDTGMGMSSIKSVVEELTKLPVTVINSHTHYDHIGGNHEFENIIAMNTSFTNGRAGDGLSHDFVKHEVTAEALCINKLLNLDTANYRINPFEIKQYIQDGSIIDLGNREIKVITTPGHTPDAISLIDIENGYVWTGDTFYEAPIWLFDEGTDLTAYHQSIQRLAAISTGITRVFPAHNTPVAKPERLQELSVAFENVLNGIAKPNMDESDEEKVRYDFEHFSFIIRKNLLLK